MEPPPLNKPASARQPTEVDVHVGEQVRQRRRQLGLSQERLADALGLTFQQVQKYERGANRISASKLWDTASFLGVPIDWFFQGLSEPSAAGVSEPQPAAFKPLTLGPEDSELLAAFQRITRKKMRRR
ncbi:MAG: helix-turn-helix domain-containing protein, partial [Pseudomonadota bacterium]|nr:helix-turn-helix domain-containing protein [Pseudomonadota bacterium]